MTNHFTDDNFQEEVLNYKSTAVLVDFYADWCGPCKMLTPIIEELAQELGNKIKIGKLDVDHSPEVAGKYGIASIPTLLVFKNGEMIEKIVGFQSKEALEEKLEKHTA